MAQLPWTVGQFMPWHINQSFVGDDGALYTAYQDANSPTGYTVVRRDQGGESFSPVNAPQDPLAQTAYFENSPYGQRLAKSEAAQAEQNQFNNTLKRDAQDLAGQTADAARANQRAQVEQAKKQLQFQYAQLEQQGQTARGQLGLNTLQLGASLRGPRDWDSYLETAAAAGQNPMLSRAMGDWASLTNIRPNTGAVNGPLPQRFDLNALASDFMGGGGGGSGAPLPRNASLDAVAMGQGPHPGWWQGLSDAERQRSQGYWEKRGWDPSTVLNGLAYQQPTQGLGYGGA